MGATTGLQAMGSYTSGTLGAKLASLLALIPDPDVRESPSPRNEISILDEMSPLAAAQLIVELEALAAGTDAGGDGVAYGVYTAIAADATANLVNIVTGLADTDVSKYTVTVWRAGVIVTADAVITEPSAGTIRVADGGVTYSVTAGDIFVWFAIDPSA